MFFITNEVLSLISLFSFLLVSSLTLLLFLNRKNNYFKNIDYFLGMLTSIALWSLFFTLENAFSDAKLKYLFFRLQYIGIVFTLHFFIVYVQSSLFHNYRPGRKQHLFMLIFDLIFLSASLFNPFGLFISSYSLNIASTGFESLFIKQGILFYIYEYFIFGSFLAGITLIAISCAKGKIMVKQAVLVIISILLPLFASAIYLFGLIHFDSTCLFLSVSALLLYISLSNYGVLDNVSFVKKNAFGLIDLPILILDKNGTVSHANEYAETLFGISVRENSSVTLNTLGLPSSADDGVVYAKSGLVEINNSAKQFFRLKNFMLKEKKGPVLGSMLLIDNVTEKVNLERKLQYIGSHDSETGLMNAESFKTLLNNFASRCESGLAGNNIYAISMGNYNQIKSQLSSKSHSDALKEIVAYISKVINPYAIFARMSENECCVFSNGTPFRLPDVEKLLVTGRSKVFCFEGISFTVDFKVGVYEIKNIDIDTQTAVECASFALSSCEGSSTKHFSVYDDHMQRQHLLFKEIVENLGRIDYEQHFEVLFQPIIDIKNMSVASAEALVRWRHPKFGLISPDRFIGVFEENGEIWHLGLFVIEQACKHLLKWHKTMGSGFCINVNVSKKQIERPEFFAEIKRIIEKYGVEPAGLEFEITETAAADNVALVKQFCRDIKALGASVALDDFGSGNTTLGFITEFELRKIKFDTSLTHEVFENKSKSVVLESMLKMCNDLSLQIVVEHVETVQLLDFFRTQGFKYIQGYVFSRPLSSDSFEKYYSDFLYTVS